MYNSRISPCPRRLLGLDGGVEQQRPNVDDRPHSTSVKHFVHGRSWTKALSQAPSQ